MTRRTVREPGDREDEEPVTEPGAEPEDDREDRAGRGHRDTVDEDVDTEDEDADGEDRAAGEPGDADDAAARRDGPAARRATVLAVLAAVCVVATAGAVWLGMRSVDAAPDDVAHVDAARTQQLTEEVDAAVTAVFSYDRGDLARTERAADRVLTGAARREYEALFARLRAQAAGSRDGGNRAGGNGADGTGDAAASGAVQSTTVRSVGVRSLTGGRAELLVLADRRVLGEDMSSRGSDSVWIDVVAVRSDGSWRIAEMSPV
ncbi:MULTISPECIES: hypothetical protein [Prauserella salsuginis group]|uniref:Mce-associated membrane protein n=1 Tax=Prauserella salsuginis TaxID=387889 RepID=A0ABW6G8B2_9PSEU|nr:MULTISPECIES: hypothetical protein [Prauserella salsuginis group]MCR3721817.1 hypothetical protein [Prauserella flava]MCR3734508.1 hypothetical protein [Prauserella salsuginis]